ncbi:NAD(P)H-binding protein [Lactiplantibacillus daowaiensis]|uniref:NAD(P)H-binding protein n=1 Tax=Lactiplantibacillus daowaiensis TaxID=2559918 RepID=A0ABW1S3K1_9LACO|nr:NAD(P)H-binding protein [Lactiplantibacillus daowaiensis]
MTKAMIIGAYGAMAQLVTARLLAETDLSLVLYLRNADRLARYADNDRVTLVDGSVLETDKLAQAMADVTVVYSNLGNGVHLAEQTASVLKAMHQAGQSRLIYISALGAHHEVPGKFGAWNEAIIAGELVGFRQTASLVAADDITYTEIRPAWLTNDALVDYEVTTLADGFKGTVVSRASVADFVVKVMQDPTTYQRVSVGLDQPGTDGDRPSGY